MSQDIREVAAVSMPPAGRWELDPAHSSAEFVARHVLTKARGRFGTLSGTIDVADRPEDSSVEVEIDAASIITGVQQRDDHLRSPDFLDVERFPKLTFKSTSVRPTGESRFELVGDLTIKDITNEVVLEAEFLGWQQDPFGNTVASFSAKTEIEREDWDMSWNVAIESGGLLVGKKVEIEIEAEAQHKPA
jgi:polyisoprenoid-binding protein YceI